MKNSVELKLKAMVAAILVMGMLVSTSLIVNAGIVELVLGEEYLEVMAEGSSSEKTHDCTPEGEPKTVWTCEHGGYKIITAAYCTYPGCGKFFGASGTIQGCPAKMCKSPS